MALEELVARLALSEGAERALGAHTITAARWAAGAGGAVGSWQLFNN